MGQEFFFLWVKEIKLHLQDPGQRYIDTEINFNIFIGLSNSSTYFNFNKSFIVQKSIFGSLAINKYEWYMPLLMFCWSKGQIDREFSHLLLVSVCFQVQGHVSSPDNSSDVYKPQRGSWDRVCIWLVIPHTTTTTRQTLMIEQLVWSFLHLTQKA